MRKLLLFGILQFGFSVGILFREPTIPVFASSLSEPNMRISTYITFQELPTIKLGDSFDLSGSIKDFYGRPVADKSILFSMDDEYLGQIRSDKDGNFQWKFKKQLNAGTYVVTASSKVTSYLAGTSSSITFNITPAELQIQTVPAIAGVAFQLDDKIFFSGADGSASTMISKIGTYHLSVLTDKYNKPFERIEFGRWLEESYQPFKDIQVPTDGVIQVGLNVYHLVGQSFVDLDGNPVDPSRVTKFTIRSIQGDVFELTDGQPRWIPSSRIARRVNGLEESKLLYSVIDVMVDGSNVVNQSQQRFYANPGDNWKISLLFYSMSVDARDGLFGNPLGDSVNLQFPDGTVKSYPLDKNGVAEIHSLPRGIYTIEFVGIKGMSNRTPVALSRDQEVHTKVITNVDMGVAGAAGMILALGLLFYGRPGLIRTFLRRKQTATQEPKAVPELAPKNVDLPVSTSVMAEVVSSHVVVKVLEPTSKIVPNRFEAALMLMHKELGNHGRVTKLSPEEQLMLTLVAQYGKQSKIRLGRAYGVSKSTVRRTIKRVRAVLSRVDAQGNVDQQIVSSNEIDDETIEDELEYPGTLNWETISNDEIVSEGREVELEGLTEYPEKVVEMVYDEST